MSTLEEKILNGPAIHYCEAGDDDIRSEVEPGLETDDQDAAMTRGDASSLFTRPDAEADSARCYNRANAQGFSTNTGPKGVLEDFRKQSAPKTSRGINEQDLDAEFEELLNDDSIIKALAQKRLAQSALLPTFGSVLRLKTGPELLDAIDKEDKKVTVIVHIYTRDSRSCSQVDRSLDELAIEFDRVKFVTIDAGVAGLSDNFKHNGVPALLAYKSGNFVTSVVQLEELLDRDFETRQLRELLLEHNLII